VSLLSFAPYGDLSLIVNGKNVFEGLEGQEGMAFLSSFPERYRR